jgi:hypothetical protein
MGAGYTDFFTLDMDSKNHLIADGLQRCCSSMATRPQPSHTNFISANLSLHICLGSACGSPQKLHFSVSSQGLHRCPGSSATAPQVVHVCAMGHLHYIEIEEVVLLSEKMDSIHCLSRHKDRYLHGNSASSTPPVLAPPAAQHRSRVPQ